MRRALATFHHGTLLHPDSLYRIAFCMLNNSPAAENCVQEPYVETHGLLPHAGKGGDFEYIASDSRRVAK